eukprot:TRINITY_DN253_c0_g1_i1.p1 TRINITY_DN253_c0_g1~~TRINITY_DN253_c0_g1_i1.p1  ORF type:complete len:418 (+),score=144.56 TRINITY_DN253_c0_g1_i1:112-1365(+)
MIRRPPRSTQSRSSAASDVYKRQVSTQSTWGILPLSGLGHHITMKGTILAVVMAGLCIASAIAEPMSAIELRKSMGEIESTESGKNIMNILQIQSSLGGSFDELRTLLQRMKSELIKQQRTEDDEWKIVEASCKSLVNGLNAQIPLYEKTVEDAKKRQANSESDQSEAERALVENQRQLSAIEGRLQRGEENYNEESGLNTDKIAKLKAAIEAIETAIKLLKTSKSSPAAVLAELDQHITKIFSVGTEFALANLASVSTKVKAIRASMTASSFIQQDDKKSELIKLLNKLGDLFRQALLDEQKIKQNSEGAWTKLRNDLNAEIATVKETITHLNQRSKKAGEEISETRGTIADNVKLLEESQKNLASISEDCTIKDQSYRGSTSTRNADVEIIDRLLAYFEEHSSAVSDYIKARPSL